jgi:4-amino-4-deoxy-L-arabinose transferase-like glycosyltransferase
MTRYRLTFPLGREPHQILFWLVWLLTMAVVFSYAKGITHSYYTLQMAPPLAGLSGIAVATLWAEFRRTGWRGWVLPFTLLPQAAWMGYLLSAYPAWKRILSPVLWGCVGVGVLTLVIARFAAPSRVIPRRLGAVALGLAAAGILASPASWAVTPCLAVASATRPVPGPEALRRSNGPMDFDRALESQGPLIEYLRVHRERQKWLVATHNVTAAAPLIVATGEPVMPIGGWQGSEPTITLEGLQQLFKEKHLRYVLFGSFNPQGGNDERFRWIRDNATPVPRKRWQQVRTEEFSRGFGPPGGFGGLAGSGLYDCQEIP